MKYDIYNGVIDTRNDVWSLNKGTPGTNGVFLKMRKNVLNTQLYYKLGSYDTVKGFYGIECAMEIIAQRIAAWEDIPYVEQRLAETLVHYNGKDYKTYCICSKGYRHSGERRVPLEQYYLWNEFGSNHTEALIQSEFADSILKTMKLDYIIYNRDRHGANIEVLYNPIVKSYRLASLFDNGCSLAAPSVLRWTELDESYYMSDAPVNNFLGSMFVLASLKDCCKGKIRMKHEELPIDIMKGLDVVLGKDLCGFIYGMLKARYANAVDILNS